jgi:hypothetical protein
MRDGPITHLRSHDAPGRDEVLDGSYPGGKSGAGIYQRLINLIPRHRILISAFAGHCGIVRNIRPAEHTIVIDADSDVCQWWDDWRRSKKGRALEIHHADSIQWLGYHFGLTEWHGFMVPDLVATPNTASGDGTFIFADPPYVLSERSSGKTYAHELCDDGHRDLLEVLTRIPTSKASAMVCGYDSPIYSKLKPWRSIAHQVPTRGGLQNEMIWLNYPETDDLHDFRHIGDSRRERERIRRRQRNWREQLNAMGDRERAAMLAVLNER